MVALLLVGRDRVERPNVNGGAAGWERAGRLDGCTAGWKRAERLDGGAAGWRTVTLLVEQLRFWLGESERNCAELLNGCTAGWGRKKLLNGCNVLLLTILYTTGLRLKLRSSNRIK